ncbi:hypothetical protein LA080_012814 [Diaporthe eres]|nr:hypothetical protein LA080_012814 [Diaporthe eres]
MKRLTRGGQGEGGNSPALATGPLKVVVVGVASVAADPRIHTTNAETGLSSYARSASSMRRAPTPFQNIYYNSSTQRAAGACPGGAGQIQPRMPSQGQRQEEREAGIGSNGLKNIDLLSDFWVTVTASSASSAFAGVAGGPGSSQQYVAHLQSRSDVKIVNYGLVMDLPNGSALQGALSDLTTRIGVWTAAWYKRMSFLRREVFATSVAPLHDEQRHLQHRRLEQEKRLVPVPLMTIMGHQWDLYFACFNAAKLITIYGPLKMGCTESILNIYFLVPSLKAVKKCIHGPFNTAMEDWFGVDARADSNCTAQQCTRSAAQLRSDPMVCQALLFNGAAVFGHDAPTGGSLCTQDASLRLFHKIHHLLPQ